MQLLSHVEKAGSIWGYKLRMNKHSRSRLESTECE